MRRPSFDLTEPSRNLEESHGSSCDDNMDMDLDLSMPPDEDDIIENDSRIYTPPPQIAARFYRPSHARRRDSAASSRRNSMSSAHSRCSSIHRSSRGDPDADQSKHVAQHLRRASFLEDRRARLADRAAHAEKVRLRAALAKATPRGPSASEERALAAQQARERNLAEIVANCAEEVKKAKQVAELTKEKREQEVAKMKAQMEERMADAERRREEFRRQTASRRARGQGSMASKPVDVMPLVSEQAVSKMTEEQAATRIQGWWRGCARKQAMQEFNSLGLSVDGIRDTSFDTVVELLAQEKVLMITARLLIVCGLREGDRGSVDEMAAVRTFLSAYLILGHPNQVLSNKTGTDGGSDQDASAQRLPPADLNNPQLQDLVGKAKDLLVAFEGALSRLTAANRYTIPPALEKTIPEAYAVFYNAFIAWKSRDSNALIEVMLMQFVELDAIFQTVKDNTDDTAAALYRQSIQDNQLMLIVRIKKLAGPEKGKKMIFKAVSEARKARSAKKKSGDTKPRVADNTLSDASATANSLVSSQSQTITPPPTPVIKRPPRTGDIRDGLNGLIPDNRVVVHELAINKEYQIPADEFVKRQADRIRPMYDSMKQMGEDTEQAAYFEFFMVITEVIKEKLQKLLRSGNSMYNLIGEILDPELAQRQFALGNFSYEKFFNAMGSLLPKLCAPFRDEAAKDLVQNKLRNGNVIDRVEAVSSFIDLMLCDYVNYLLSIAAPQLLESAAEYEAKSTLR